MGEGDAGTAASLDIVKREWMDIDCAVKEQKMQEVMVDIGECAIGDASKVLVCLGLGSCVGVVIFDINRKVAGLAHVMLASKSMGFAGSESLNLSKKFADVAVPYLVESLLKAGCAKGAMRSKIAGGAQMFKDSSDELFDIGRRNVASVKEILKGYNIPVISEDIYGSEGRTMKFVVDTSKAYVRTKSRMIAL